MYTSSIVVETAVLSVLVAALTACGRSELELFPVASSTGTATPPAPTIDGSAPVDAAPPPGQGPDASPDAAAEAEACVPLTCAMVGCGAVADGCGGALTCAKCPPSCDVSGTVPGVTDCGPGGQGSESCCASPPVPGGTFFRSYDGVSAGYTSRAFPAQVSAFRLDRYEATVGRFRRFVDAVVAGWAPPAGSGKHGSANAGQGLANGFGGYESGWDGSWTSALLGSKAEWDSALACEPDAAWTASPGATENHPISCVTWAQAYAFCIWDDGFLPSEAEWNVAAAGAEEQRVYPWSIPPQSTEIDATFANCAFLPGDGGLPPRTASTPVGFESPKGDGKWRHADMAGNIFELVLDLQAPYLTPCLDCANTCTTCGASSSARTVRGGSYEDAVQSGMSSWLLASARTGVPAVTRNHALGFRCARAL